MTIFCCEDTVDGIFTAVYDAWDSGLGLANVTVQAGENHDRNLFASYVITETDHGKAQKVARTLRARLGMEDYQVIYQAALSCGADKGAVIFAAAVLGLAVLRKKNITRNLGNTQIMRLFELSRRVEQEGHRYRMFVRFRELEHGEGEASVMFSQIEPESQVLPLLGGHFADRFPMMNFMIYDRTHSQCLVHPSGKQWVIAQDARMEEGRITRYSREEEAYAKLWRGFVSSVAIKERENPRCQMNFMPKKYWKYMTEHM